MGRALSIVLIALLAGCSGPRVLVKPPPPEIQKATREVMKVCIPGDDDLVRCPKEAFREYGHACMTCGKRLQKEKAENQLLRSTGALDLQAEQARADELQRKLDSPWRSWWLWTLIGAAAAGAILTGVYWGGKPAGQSPCEFPFACIDRPGM